MKKQRRRARPLTLKQVIPILIALAALLAFAIDYFEEAPLNPQAAAPQGSEATPPPAPSPAGDTPTLTMHFIDVGQGDAILIEGETQSMLIDAGTGQSEKTLIEYLLSRGIESLDLVCATHPHADHIGGMAGVIRAFTPGRFIMPEATHNSQTFEDMLDALLETETDSTYAYAGDSFTLDGASITVLSPQKGYSGSNLNNYSLVLQLEYGGSTVLLTGDCEQEVEEVMLKGGLLKPVDLLKVAHHGSATSSSLPFLSALSPSVSVISVAAKNSYGHPSDEVLSRLYALDSRIFSTSEHGTIRALLKEQEIVIEYDQ